MTGIIMRSQKCHKTSRGCQNCDKEMGNAQVNEGLQSKATFSRGGYITCEYSACTLL